MAKQSRPKCKFCGALMDKKDKECPTCGLSKALVAVHCVQCGARFGVDPRDQSAKLCPDCDRKKSNKRILIKAGVIGAAVVLLVAYRVFKNLMH